MSPAAPARPDVRKAVERFDASASESGALIVHSCGYDSIPVVNDPHKLSPDRAPSPRRPGRPVGGPELAEIPVSVVAA